MKAVELLLARGSLDGWEEGGRRVNGGKERG